MAGRNNARRERLWRKQRGLCHLCGLKMNWNPDGTDQWGATLDHIIPKSVPKPSGVPNNYKLAHKKCNMQRGNALLETTREK